MPSPRRRHRPRHGPPGRRPRRLHDLINDPQRRRSALQRVGRPERLHERRRASRSSRRSYDPTHRRPRWGRSSAAPRRPSSSPANDRHHSIPDGRARSSPPSGPPTTSSNPVPARSPEPRLATESGTIDLKVGSVAAGLPAQRSRSSAGLDRNRAGAERTARRPASASPCRRPGSVGIDRGRATKGWRRPTSTCGELAADRRASRRPTSCWTSEHHRRGSCST